MSRHLASVLASLRKPAMMTCVSALFETDPGASRMAACSRAAMAQRRALISLSDKTDLDVLVKVGYTPDPLTH